MDKKICFVGAGAMAEALVRGLLEQKVVKPGQISVTNRDDRFRLDELVYNFGVVANAEHKYRSIAEADILILAMKPKDVSHALQEIRPFTSPEQLIISVIAGISTTSISAQLCHEAPVIRSMPNTSAVVGKSATGIAPGAYAGQAHVETARQIFESIGLVIVTDEEKMDAITGVSGSGPAYVYLLVESMLNGAQAVGLTYAEAKDLVLQTIIGAATMLVETNEDPATLRRQVTSPNGTTQAGLEILAQYNFEQAVQRCIQRATERSAELRQEYSADIK
jgi:pyrroline-5-carboxylate reductase